MNAGGGRMTIKGVESAPDPGESARYIESMARELRRLASGSGLGFLAFLLRMVEDDAAAEARRHDDSQAG